MFELFEFDKARGYCHAKLSGVLAGSLSRQARKSRVPANSRRLLFETVEARRMMTTFVSDLADFSAPGGAIPDANVIEDSSGNLFGTTSSGGSSNNGTVFEWVKSTGTLSTLVAFNGTDGAQPEAGLVEDSSGNLFGTTAAGGPGSTGGTVFEWVKGSGTLSSLITLGGTVGQAPQAGVIEDASGNLFGTTGAFDSPGAVFEVSNLAQLVVTASASTVAAGSTINLTLTAEDQSGNVITGYNDSVTLSDSVGGALFAVDPVVTFTNGVATIAATLDTTGAQTITATDSTATISGTSSSITVTSNGPTTLTIPSAANQIVDITFSSATNFSVSIGGNTPTNYTTSNVNVVNYTGAAGSELIFNDPITSDAYTATQSFSSTTLLRSGGSFQLNAASVATLYIYTSDPSSTATVNVTSASGSDNFNFFVDAASSSPGYSYIADPGTGIYSELSGFSSVTPTGSGSTTYAYVYSTTDATTVASPTQTTFTVGTATSTLTNFPQVYIVGAADGTDSITLDSAGNEFVSSPTFSYVTNGTNILVGAIYAANLKAQAAGSKDAAVFYSYPSNTFNGASGTSTLSGSTLNVKQATVNFTSQALGYLNVSVFESGGGTDTANLTSSGAGSLFSTAASTALTVGSSVITVNTYYAPSGQIVALAGTIVVTGAGSDTASVYDSTGANALSASGTTATLTAGSRSLTINRFATVTANQTSGTDDTVHQAANLGFTLTTVGSWTSD